MGNSAGWPVFWLELKAKIDTRQLLTAAIERGVAFMPGEAFFADAASARSTLRLNFSHASEADAERGQALLAELLKEEKARSWGLSELRVAEWANKWQAETEAAADADRAFNVESAAHQLNQFAGNR